MNKLVIVLIVIIGLAGAYYYFGGGINSSVSGTQDESQMSSDTSSAMRVEDNAVVVLEQRPGTTVRGTVFLAAPGYLVIHEGAGGKPGAILGASALLRAGENSNVNVTLSRAMQEGETLHAMLHFEKGGNTTFSAAEDTPVPSSQGGPISGWFEVSADASIDAQISI